LTPYKSIAVDMVVRVGQVSPGPNSTIVPNRPTAAQWLPLQLTPSRVFVVGEGGAPGTLQFTPSEVEVIVPPKPTAAQKVVVAQLMSKRLFVVFEFWASHVVPPSTLL
jgi:hypothetical protein